MIKDALKIFSIILFGTLLVVTGCSSSENLDEDNNIEIIKTVLTNTFTGPSEELSNIFEDLGSDDMEVLDSAIEERESYYRSVFQSYFTEDYYETVMMTDFVSVFHQEAHRNDFQMEVEDISVEQNENADTSYDFIVKMQFNQEEHEVKGRVGINEDGDIFKIIYHNADELYKQMK